jgi:sugar/nucleoside kinase (ribokinase family)
MPSRNQIAVCGYSSNDYSMQTEKFEGFGHTTLIRNKLSTSWPEVGGIARFIPGLSAQNKVSAISWVGDDLASDGWIQGVKNSGGRVEGIAQLSGNAPTSYLFHQSKGETLCFFHQGIRDPESQNLDSQQISIIQDSSHVVLAIAPERVAQSLLGILDLAQTLMWVVKADNGSQSIELRSKLFERANIIVYSHQEEAFLKKIPFIGNKDPLDLTDQSKVLIMTSGKSQVHWAEKGNRYTSDVVPIEDQVNSTGAGDYFAGQFFGNYIQRIATNICISEAISKTYDFLRLRDHESEMN